MNHIIQLISDRLQLRPIQLEDADSVLEYRSNAQANEYQGWIPNTIEDVHDFIKNKVSPEINLPETWFQLVIIKNDTHELIGDIGVHFSESEESLAELGCTLNQNHQGNGYATEALTETIGFLFGELNKRRIIASIDPRNLSSVRLFERLGFRKEAHFKQSFFMNGEWVDDLIYAILKEEWNANR
ncbi:MAG TPA: GNAT family protein [Prolixibacteraceae bacterium]|nr:GNAT family protein [Prolixibacteraceae bacterium]